MTIKMSRKKPKPMFRFRLRVVGLSGLEPPTPTYADLRRQITLTLNVGANAFALNKIPPYQP